MIRIFIMKPNLKCDIRLCFVINFNNKNALFPGKSHIAHLSLYRTTQFLAYQFQTASVLCYVLHFSSITPAVLPVSTTCIFFAANFCVGCVFCETLCISLMRTVTRGGRDLGCNWSEHITNNHCLFFNLGFIHQNRWIV